MILTAIQDDTLDLLIYRHYGRTTGLVELALEYNPQLADSPILAIGQQVEMPDIEFRTTSTRKETVSLWD
ncbi:tail protein [[Actinobacillus] muris]|uniref:Tail protein n=2 Tax=Muribacter muris TaxID=67855 RepID=A0A0J5P474_9PAST|nr:tail protein X [Muribacter muris]KMK50485.1 tail protein [[Actinobacillus] muris] [Muribacter muris]